MKKKSIWSYENLLQAIADAGHKCVLELRWEPYHDDPKRRHYTVTHNELLPPHQIVNGPSFDPEAKGFQKLC